jgi:hypothetical protein
MSVRYQIRCDCCGERQFVKTLTDEDLPSGWKAEMGLRWHACCGPCRKQVDKQHAKDDGRLLIWNESKGR